MPTLPNLNLPKLSFCSQSSSKKALSPLTPTHARKAQILPDIEDIYYQILVKKFDRYQCKTVVPNFFLYDGRAMP